MFIHAEYRAVKTGETDSVCCGDKRPTTNDLDKVTCSDCLRIIARQERLVQSSLSIDIF